MTVCLPENVKTLHRRVPVSPVFDFVNLDVQGLPSSPSSSLPPHLRHPIHHLRRLHPHQNPDKNRLPNGYCPSHRLCMNTPTRLSPNWPLLL